MLFVFVVCDVLSINVLVNVVGVIRKNIGSVLMSIFCMFSCKMLVVTFVG